MALWHPSSPKVYNWIVGPYRMNADDVQIYKMINWEYVKAGRRVFIGDFCLLNAGEGLEIGDDTAIHAHCSIIGSGTTKIGKRCSIGYYTIIVNGTDTYRKPDIRDYRPKMSSTLPESERAVKTGSVIIEDDVYIGPYCTITIPQQGSDKITIGANSVIGAYTYIDRDIPQNMVVHPIQTLLLKDVNGQEPPKIRLSSLLSENTRVDGRIKTQVLTKKLEKKSRT